MVVLGDASLPSLPVVATPVGTVLSKKTFRVAGLHGTLSKLNGLEARAYEVPDTSGVAIPGLLRVPVNDKLSIELSSGQYLQELGWEFAWQQIMQKTAAQGASNNRAKRHVAPTHQATQPRPTTPTTTTRLFFFVLANQPAPPPPHCPNGSHPQLSILE